MKKSQIDQFRNVIKSELCNRGECVLIFILLSQTFLYIHVLILLQLRRSRMSKGSPLFDPLPQQRLIRGRSYWHISITHPFGTGPTFSFGKGTTNMRFRRMWKIFLPPVPPPFVCRFHNFWPRKGLYEPQNYYANGGPLGIILWAGISLSCCCSS